MHRVAIFQPSLRGGGAQRVAVDVANGLVSREWQVELVLASGEGVYQSLLDERVGVVDLGAGRVSRSILSLLRYLRESQPSTLLAIQRHAVIVAWLASLFSGWKGRLVARETNSFQKVPGRNRGWRNAVLASLVKWIYRDMDCVVVPSRGIASELSHLPNVITIPNPVTIPTTSEKFNHERPYILGAGSLDKQKRFDDLISAFAMLRNDYAVSDLDLIILGDGPDRKRLHELAKKPGLEKNLIMPGFVNDPFKYMRAAEVFVLTSGWEGLPNVLIQAMACGAPVVATDCPHGPREILDNGRFGKLVPVGDIKAIAQAIYNQLQNKKTSYPADALAPYDYDRVIGAYESVLTGHISQ